MLGTPSSGKVEITIGGQHIGLVSDTSEPAMEFLNSFIKTLTYEGEPAAFYAEFDDAGQKVGVIEFDRELYVIRSEREKGQVTMTPLGISADMLLALAKECADDISSNLEAWVQWGNPAQGFGYALERKGMLQARISKLNAIIQMHNTADRKWEEKKQQIESSGE